MLIKTERLLLQDHSLDNVLPMFGWMNDPDLVRLEYDSDYEPQTQFQVTKLLVRYIEDTEAKSEFHLGIRVAASQALIGYCGLVNLNLNHFTCTPYLVIGETTEWGKGYGTEVLHALRHLAFETLPMHRMETNIFTYNTRSISLFEKLGFQREGVRKQSKFKEKQFVDECFYALINENWTPPTRKA